MNMAPQDQDPRNLHDLAVDVQTDTQKLATGLAHAGAAPAAVAQLTKMAELVGQVVKVLGPQEGPVGGQGQPGPANPVPGQEQPAPQSGPPQQAEPQAPQSAAAPQQAQQHSLHSAAHSLHAAMIASAAARRP